MLGFARHLPRFDWHLSVLAPPCLPWEPVDKRLLNELPDDIVVHPVEYPCSRASKIVRRFAQNGAWLPRALAAIRRIMREERPDVLLTSGPPQCVHLLGMYVKRHYALPWVADFRDPWVVGDRQERWRSLRVWCARHCEASIIRQADRIVCNAPLACAALQASYPAQREKMITITNGFDPSAFPRRKPPQGNGREFVLVHTGELYYGRDPRPFLDALRKLHSPTLRVRFLGRATVGDLDLHAEIASRGLQHIVELGGQVTYDESLRAMAGADVLILFDSPGRRVGVPAKLYEYLGAGAAVLALTDATGDAAWVLRESGVLHRIASPKDTGQIHLALAELVDCLSEGQPVAPKPECLAAFTREAIGRQMAEELDGLFAPSDTRSGEIRERRNGRYERILSIECRGAITEC
jgi:glycosyltransferase involved in cell wall biosynthesis